MSLERRRHARVAEEMRFALQGGPLPAGKVVHGTIVDMSEGGAAFESDAPLPDGQTIVFELRLPLKVQAKIVRSERKEGKYRYGVQFDDIEWMDKETLRRYITQRLGGV